MAQNNLRIISNNIADLATTTITASSSASTATPAVNMAKDAKGLVWKSIPSTSTPVTSGSFTAGQQYVITYLGSTTNSNWNSAAGTSSVTYNIGSTFTAINSGIGSTSGTATIIPKANLVVTFLPTNIGGIHLPFCNLSQQATIRVIGYSGTSPTMGGGPDLPTYSPGATQVFDTGIVSCCPYSQLGPINWPNTTVGATAYSYGGGVYARVWSPTGNALLCTSLLILIVDPGNTSTRCIEASRLVIGQYWAPTYNTSFGLTSTMKDNSTQTRNEAGDLITNRGTRYNSMNFNLNWLNPSDRLNMTNIIRYNGMTKPVYVSLFPDNTTDWDKEREYQIWGKFVSTPTINNFTYEMYSTTIDIEEV